MMIDDRQFVFYCWLLILLNVQLSKYRYRNYSTYRILIWLICRYVRYIIISLIYYKYSLLLSDILFSDLFKIKYVVFISNMKSKCLYLLNVIVTWQWRSFFLLICWLYLRQESHCRIYHLLTNSRMRRSLYLMRAWLPLSALLKYVQCRLFILALVYRLRFMF